LYAFFPQATPNDQYAGYRNSFSPNANVGNVGFRVASVPEPPAILLVIVATAIIWEMKARRSKAAGSPARTVDDIFFYRAEDGMNSRL
jgi:hypothetical protein